MELVKDFTAEAQSFRREQAEKNKTRRFSALALRLCREKLKRQI
jgi:hypothetical protein